jgi:hypothetical protein
MQSNQENQQMNLNRIIVITAFSFAVFSALSQPAGCNHIEERPLSSARFKSGDEGLARYVVTEIVPVLSSCLSENDALIASLHINITINDYGHVVDVVFLNSRLSSKCEGTMNGLPVCSKFYWPISCLKPND